MVGTYIQIPSWPWCRTWGSAIDQRLISAQHLALSLVGAERCRKNVSFKLPLSPLSSFLGLSVACLYSHPTPRPLRVAFQCLLSSPPLVVLVKWLDSHPFCIAHVVCLVPLLLASSSSSIFLVHTAHYMTASMYINFPARIYLRRGPHVSHLDLGVVPAQIGCSIEETHRAVRKDCY